MIDARGDRFVGLLGIEPQVVNAYDAGSGALLARFPMPGSVNSAAARPKGALTSREISDFALEIPRRSEEVQLA